MMAVMLLARCLAGVTGCTPAPVGPLGCFRTTSAAGPVGGVGTQPLAGPGWAGQRCWAPGCRVPSECAMWSCPPRPTSTEPGRWRRL